LPACNTARSTSVIRIPGKERAERGTVGASKGISPTSAWFWSRFLARTALLAESVTAGGWSGDRGSLRGGV